MTWQIRTSYGLFYFLPDWHRELRQMLTVFQNSFTCWLSGQFAPKSYLNIPPHLNYVVTLPCEILVSENWRQFEILIVINDKLHGSIAEYLSFHEVVFITNLSLNLLVTEFLKSVNTWRSYRQNGWLCHTPHSLYTFVRREAELAR